MDQDNYIPLSYISQYGYCKRRAGLLLLEQQWKDSTDTVKGSAEHKIVHETGISSRNAFHVLTDMQVYSNRLNLLGRCDAVEAIESEQGCLLPFINSIRCLLYPIEYKHGKLRTEPEYELQLCAQAMCLEEMYECQIDSGAVFFINSHRRKEVIFDTAMRDNVRQTAFALSQMLMNQMVPDAESSPKCLRCSLRDICMPDVMPSVSAYMDQIHNDLLGGCEL